MGIFGTKRSSLQVKNIDCEKNVEVVDCLKSEYTPHDLQTNKIVNGTKIICITIVFISVISNTTFS